MNYCGLAFAVAATTLGCSVSERAPVIADIRHDYKTCHVHRRPLVEAVEPVQWGTVQRLPCSECDELFPFSMQDVVLYGPENVEFARLMYCPDCRIAEAGWIERNRRAEWWIVNPSAPDAAES
jgi:hypothetical protein